MTRQIDPQALRERVLNELALVQGRIELANSLGARGAKEQLRLAHSAQRAAVLADAADFLQENEESLLDEFANGSEIDPGAIDPMVIPARTPAEEALFRFATLQWSVPVSAGYGRRSRFLVRDRQNGKLIGIFALGDPVIAQGARDSTIGWTTEQRNDRLYNVYDAFVLGAVDPYRQLMGGKLTALLTLSNETREFLIRKYAGKATEIRGEVKDPTPVLITTSSALGRSSVYNRVTFRGALMFHSVGFTRGFGHFQFSNKTFELLRELVRQHDRNHEGSSRDQSSRYGKGPNWRFRVIRNALELLDIPEESLQHNVRREVFIAPTAANWDSFLRGQADQPELLNLPVAELGEYYRRRWAVGRAERLPGYRYWRREEARLVHLLGERSLRTSYSVSSSPPHGSVELGDWHLAVGVGRKTVKGETLSGQMAEGSAYLSRLEGPELELTLADITWDGGEREVRGWSRHSSDATYESIIGRLRIGVYPVERFRGMLMMELRAAEQGANGGRASVRKVSARALSSTVGFDVGRALDEATEATVGTRSELLGDQGRRRAQLCVVFRASDLLTPALAWTFVRPLTLVASSRVPVRMPSPPRVRRVPPRMSDLSPDGSKSASA